MAEKIDRRIGSTGLVVTTIVIAAVVALALFALWRFRSTPERSVSGPVIAIRNPRPDEPLTVQRYLPQEQVLTAGAIAVKRAADTQAQAREIAASLLMPEGRTPVLSDLRMRSFFLDNAGTAFVDVTAAGQEIRASVWDELLAVYAVVDTLSQNFEEIRQVRFLVDGREAQTLAGHIDLSRAFTKRMDLVKQ